MLLVTPKSKVPGSRELSPEEHLCAAMLRRAWWDLWLYGPGTVQDDARNWLECGEDRPFSFVWCCEVTGLCEEWVRTLIVGTEAKSKHAKGYIRSKQG